MLECEDVAICIQHHTFNLDLYILPISDANIILSVQWLKTLGPVLTNYNTLSMQFFHQDQLVELKGDHTSDNDPLTQHQFRRLYRPNKLPLSQRVSAAILQVNYKTNDFY